MSHPTQPAPITSPAGTPKVGIIMGSQSDWATMSEAAQILADFGVAFECEVVSAHRTPDKLFDYAKAAKDKGLQIIIAGAGGAAHLPGMCASQTPLPVLGVPVKSSTLSGWGQFIIHRADAKRRGGWHACDRHRWRI